MTKHTLSRRMRGLTLIELLIAMVLGILVAGGILTVFISTSASNKAQAQMATLQENGRYAMGRLRDDVGMANALYCSASGGKPDASQPAGAPVTLDTISTPTVYVKDELVNALPDISTLWTGAYGAEPNEPYAMPEFFYMRGYDCGLTSCTPVDPSTSMSIPTQGKNIGDRVVGSSILTMRYVDSNKGWSLGEGASYSVAVAGGNTLDHVKLVPRAHEPPISEFGDANDHLAMLADCHGSVVFKVSGQGSDTLTPTADNFEIPAAFTGGQAVRFFNFNKHFRTVTYYLKVVDGGNGRTTGALIRRENGNDQELVRGISRLNFLYGAMQRNGEVRFLTAAQVDGAGVAACPTYALQPGGGAPSTRAGCLWRALQAIEINFLMDGQVPLGSLSDAELAYTYASDAIMVTPAEPQDHPIQPDADQGFPKRLLRREFTGLLSIRNYNP